MESEVSRLEATETAQGAQLVSVSHESSDSSRHLHTVRDSQSSQSAARAGGKWRGALFHHRPGELG